MNKTINVTRSSMPTFEEYCEEIRELWDSRWLTNSGVKHRELEADLRAYLGVPHAVLYTNGHLALEHVLSALNLPKGGEVITTPFTFVSTTHAIARMGLVPVFCDVEETYYTLNPQKIEACITDKTCAIMPVHVYGNLCDVDAIAAIAARHNLPVIYDAAHAFGVLKDGVSVANFGTAAMFSFHATKVYNTIEGGALCFAQEGLEEKLNILKNFGQQGEDCPLVGANAKMNEFQAAMGICNLRHLPDEIAKRRRAALRYRQHLSGVNGITLCPEQEGVTPNYAYFPVVFDGYKYTRDEVFARLAAEHIVARKYFYPLTSKFTCYRDAADAHPTPVAAHVAQNVLTLPLFADLTEADVDRICKIILG